MVLIKLIHRYTINHCALSTKNGCIRRFSFKSVKNTFTNYFRSKPLGPPYDHICQIGDPVLRMKATSVDVKVIETREFGTLLQQMKDVMRKYHLTGLSAPQIGIPLSVFAIEVRNDDIKLLPRNVRNALQMEVVPLTYFINPTVKIQNPEQIVFTESCGSLTGFRAQVSRAKEVEVTALNLLGTIFTWKAEGWTARIVQHEFDHLQGKLYVDKMDSSTFECSMWNQINKHKGKIAMKFCAK